ncbi:MAG: patatin-like phospholipase family protein, partial [Gammaproteobacteria bacterium]|nr:patatin-like phospholipase family protein [Gammaproteobacteria bacterium]
TFFQGMHGVISWSRTRRDGRMTEITLDHLMASSAIPFIFPAARIGPEYFGDGSMRQAAPLSPAIHLGADKLLVIGVRNEEPNIIGADSDTKTYPTFGQIAGYILDTLFMDSLHTDVERLRRINVLLRRIKQKNPQPSFNDLRELQVAIIAPSEDIRDIALRHVKRFPRTVRTLLRVLGARNESGNQLISYLLFDGDYCRDLIELGYQDGLSQTRVLRQFIDDESEATE